MYMKFICNLYFYCQYVSRNTTLMKLDLSSLSRLPSNNPGWFCCVHVPADKSKASHTVMSLPVARPQSQSKLIAFRTPRGLTGLKGKTAPSPFPDNPWKLAQSEHNADMNPFPSPSIMSLFGLCPWWSLVRTYRVWAHARAHATGYWLQLINGHQCHRFWMLDAEPVTPVMQIIGLQY